MANIRVLVVMLLAVGLVAAASTRRGARRPRHPQSTYGAPQGQAAAAGAVQGVQGAPRPAVQPAGPADQHQGMPYNFAWAVKDPQSLNDYGHQENSDGRVVSGSYRVLLPDGRTQIVSYRVEGDSGFVADVRYEGSVNTNGPNPAVNGPVNINAPQRNPNNAAQGPGRY